MHRTTYDALRREKQKTLGKPNSAAVGPEKTLSRRNFKRKLSNKLRLVAKEQKQREAPTLIRMGEKSGSLTPFGSLGDASHGVDGAHRSTVYRRSNSIKLAWRCICNLFLAVWQHAAFRTH